MAELTPEAIPTTSYGPHSTKTAPVLTHDYTAPDGSQYHTEIRPNGWFVHEGADASGREIAHRAYPLYDPLTEAKAAIAKHYNGKASDGI